MKLENTPEVSIIIPFYSNKSWLEDALESVLNQTFKNYEILVINDGSLENIDYLKDKYSDNSIIFFNKKNGGPSSARNLGITKAKGRYIAFLDSDDFWEPTKLEKQVKFMKYYNYHWSHHSYYLFNDKTHKKKEVDTSILNGNVMFYLFTSFKAQTSTIMLERRILLEDNILFPLDKRYGQDIYFYIEIAKKYELGYCDGYLSYFRIRGNNAGYNPYVQLMHKASLNEHVQQSDYSENIKKSYRMINKSYKKVKKINNTKLRNLFSGLFYIVPYTMLHVESWRHRR